MEVRLLSSQQGRPRKKIVEKAMLYSPKRSNRTSSMRMSIDTRQRKIPMSNKRATSTTSSCSLQDCAVTPRMKNIHIRGHSDYYPLAPSALKQLNQNYRDLVTNHTDIRDIRSSRGGLPDHVITNNSHITAGLRGEGNNTINVRISPRSGSERTNNDYYDMEHTHENTQSRGPSPCQYSHQPHPLHHKGRSRITYGSDAKVSSYGTHISSNVQRDRQPANNGSATLWSPDTSGDDDRSRQSQHRSVSYLSPSSMDGQDLSHFYTSNRRGQMACPSSDRIDHVARAAGGHQQQLIQHHHQGGNSEGNGCHVNHVHIHEPPTPPSRAKAAGARDTVLSLHLPRSQVTLTTSQERGAKLEEYKDIHYCDKDRIYHDRRPTLLGDISSISGVTGSSNAEDVKGGKAGRITVMHPPALTSRSLLENNATMEMSISGQYNKNTNSNNIKASRVVTRADISHRKDTDTQCNLSNMLSINSGGANRTVKIGVATNVISSSSGTGNTEYDSNTKYEEAIGQYLSNNNNNTSTRLANITLTNSSSQTEQVTPFDFYQRDLSHVQSLGPDTTVTRLGVPAVTFIKKDLNQTPDRAVVSGLSTGTREGSWARSSPNDTLSSIIVGEVRNLFSAAAQEFHQKPNQKTRNASERYVNITTSHHSSSSSGEETRVETADPNSSSSVAADGDVRNNYIVNTKHYRHRGDKNRLSKSNGSNSSTNAVSIPVDLSPTGSHNKDKEIRVVKVVEQKQNGDTSIVTTTTTTTTTYPIDVASPPLRPGTVSALFSKRHKNDDGKPQSNVSGTNSFSTHFEESTQNHPHHTHSKPIKPSISSRTSGQIISPCSESIECDDAIDTYQSHNRETYDLVTDNKRTSCAPSSRNTWQPLDPFPTHNRPTISNYSQLPTGREVSNRAQSLSSLDSISASTITSGNESTAHHHNMRVSPSFPNVVRAYGHQNDNYGVIDPHDAYQRETKQIPNRQPYSSIKDTSTHNVRDYNHFESIYRASCTSTDVSAGERPIANSNLENRSTAGRTDVHLSNSWNTSLANVRGSLYAPSPYRIGDSGHTFVHNKGGGVQADPRPAICHIAVSQSMSGNSAPQRSDVGNAPYDDYSYGTSRLLQERRVIPSNSNSYSAYIDVEEEEVSDGDLCHVNSHKSILQEVDHMNEPLKHMTPYRTRSISASRTDEILGQHSGLKTLSMTVSVKAPEHIEDATEKPDKIYRPRQTKIQAPIHSVQCSRLVSPEKPKELTRLRNSRKKKKKELSTQWSHVDTTSHSPSLQTITNAAVNGKHTAVVSSLGEAPVWESMSIESVTQTVGHAVTVRDSPARATSVMADTNGSSILEVSFRHSDHYTTAQEPECAVGGPKVDVLESSRTTQKSILAHNNREVSPRSAITKPERFSLRSCGFRNADSSVRGSPHVFGTDPSNISSQQKKSPRFVLRGS